MRLYLAVLLLALWLLGWALGALIARALPSIFGPVPF